MTDSGFVHSVKVPQVYKTTARILKTIAEEGGSLKDLVYTKVRSNIKAVYALITKTLESNELIDNLIQECNILEENPRFDIWLAKALITELLFGKQHLSGSSKPVLCIQGYQDKLLKAFEGKNIVKESKSGCCLNSHRLRFITMAESSTMFLLLGCSIAMFTLPFIAFFGVRDVLRDEFGFVGFAPTAWGVLASVVVVNLIILFYAYYAYKEEVREERTATDSVEDHSKTD